MRLLVRKDSSKTQVVISQLAIFSKQVIFACFSLNIFAVFQNVKYNISLKSMGPC